MKYSMQLAIVVCTPHTESAAQHIVELYMMATSSKLAALGKRCARLEREHRSYPMTWNGTIFKYVRAINYNVIMDRVSSFTHEEGKSDGRRPAHLQISSERITGISPRVFRQARDYELLSFSMTESSSSNLTPKDIHPHEACRAGRVP